MKDAKNSDIKMFTTPARKWKIWILGFYQHIRGKLLAKPIR